MDCKSITISESSSLETQEIQSKTFKVEPSMLIVKMYNLCIKTPSLFPAVK